MKSLMVGVALFFLSSIGNAQSGVESLSPELRALLSKEMNALQEGMQSILPAYVSGDFQSIVDIAKKIEHSFIMKQTITDSQKHELMEKMPKSFLHLDKKFHQHAGMLAHVAEEKHVELVGFYYYKLNEACVSCHRQFASHRFPNLKDDVHNKEHKH